MRLTDLVVLAVQLVCIAVGASYGRTINRQPVVAEEPITDFGNSTIAANDHFDVNNYLDSDYYFDYDDVIIPNDEEANDHFDVNNYFDSDYYFDADDVIIPDAYYISAPPDVPFQ